MSCFVKWSNADVFDRDFYFTFSTVCFYLFMWEGGWVKGWVEKLMDGWIDECIDEWMNGWMNEWMNG